MIVISNSQAEGRAREGTLRYECSITDANRKSRGAGGKCIFMPRWLSEVRPGRFTSIVRCFFRPAAESGFGMTANFAKKEDLIVRTSQRPLEQRHRN